MDKDNVIEFPGPDKSEASMEPEDLKGLIETNQMLQYCLKIMNDIPLEDETPVDYMELWNKVALQQKIDPGEVNRTKHSILFPIT